MSEKFFLLGLGHQKCGTSWLYSYLNKSIKFNGGFEKEYHIWDANDCVDVVQNKVAWWKQFIQLNQRERYKMQNKEGYYFDYFHSLYSDSIFLSGDLTPLYSGLPESRLRYIKQEFLKRKIIVKPIVLVREPVARIKSAVRYNLDRARYSEGVSCNNKDYIEALKEYYMTKHCKIRTEYNKTIIKAHKVFGESNVFVGIYESMFSKHEIDRFSNFANIAVNYAFADVYVNKTKSEIESHPKIESAIKLEYNYIYDYFYENFPCTKKLWN